MNDDAPVLLIGPWPPPVHGMAVMHARMSEAIAARVPVRQFDVSGQMPGAGGPPGPVQRARHLLRLAGEVRCTLRNAAPRSMFMSTSAGAVMAFDGWCARQAARHGVPVHVHHHSWTGLHGGGLPWFLRGAFAGLRPHRHWVLCEHMRTRLITTHRIAADAVGVLSNAALVDEAAASAAPARPAVDTKFTLGFYSKVAASKGIGSFLDVVERLQAAGRPVAARVAGPVDASIAAEVYGRLAALQDAIHVGVLQGDAAKAGYFAGIHRLLLPSRHVHEAEPLVVIEALAHGVPVIATARGCLPSVWAHPEAVRLFPVDGFTDTAVEAVCAELDAGIDVVREAAVARAWYQERHQAGRKQLNFALAAITRLREASL